MKLILLALFAVTFSFASALAQDTYVDGYVKNDGTYVQPHFRSQADSYSDNNFSTQGNTNPYTGSVGRENLPSLNPGQDGYNRQTPTTRNWNNNRRYGSSYKRPQSGM